MNLPEPPVAEIQRPAAAMKFTYASGSRPLDGYTIKRGVGRGGFGEVYFATSDAGKEVALKLIRRNLDVELRGATQCLNLKHPNLIGLYDIRTDDTEDQWIIMEYVAGESLEEVIERHPNGMPTDLMLGWMRGICNGVAYLHDHGIVHRDLKPGNIFIDEGTVKIGDYGLAKFISCSRRSGQTESVGTVHYMAPEIANGRYGREIDTYALGIILFEMITGNVPFEGESVGEVLMKHLTAEPDLTRLAEPYRDIVRRALAKDPEVRLKNVGELLNLLPGGSEAALAAGQFAPTPAPPAAETASPARKPAARKMNDSFAGPIEEPIAAALREAIASLQVKPGIPGSKQRVPITLAVCAMIFIAVMIVGFGEVIGISITALLCYGIYYLVWLVLIRPSVERQAQRNHQSIGDRAAGAKPLASPHAQPMQGDAAGRPLNDIAAPSSPAERYAQKVRRRRMRASWRERAHRELAERPFKNKLLELLGSMLIAALVVTLVSMALPVLGIVGWPTYVWTATVATLGTWAILAPAKFTEGRVEDQTPMRLTMLLLGGLVGAAAFGIGETLLVDLPHSQPPIDSNWGLISHEMLGWPRPPRFNLPGGNPSFAAYVTFFAFLFLIVRWWRRAEFTRSARLSVWAVAGCVFAAWLVHLFWWFPQPAGMMIAGAIALATQLASPWMPPSQRRALAEEIERGV